MKLTCLSTAIREAIPVGIALGMVSLGMVLGAPAARADYESFTLSPGFDPNPVMGSGQSGGDRWVDNCGYVNAEDAPDHILTLTDYFDYLQVNVVADGDVTLFMQRIETGETQCVDDANDTLLPEFGGTWPAGVYYIWVGDWQKSYHPYELYISHD